MSFSSSVFGNDNNNDGEVKKPRTLLFLSLSLRKIVNSTYLEEERKHEYPLQITSLITIFILFSIAISTRYNLINFFLRSLVNHLFSGMPLLV